MALIKCLECGNDVSDKASACPKCGAPVIRSSSGTASAENAPAKPAIPVSAQQPSPAVSPPSSPKLVKRSKPFLSTGRLLTWAFIVGGGWLAFKLLTGSSLVGAVQGPQAIVNERVELKEGNAMGYAFRLPSQRRIDVEVSAQPKNINVMLMTEEQWAKYQKVKGSLWGGQYQYTQGLSRQGVLTWSGSEILPAGSWRLVIERPSEALLFGDATSASVKITAH